jgi:ATP-dependent helicase/nuclease subunit B
METARKSVFTIPSGIDFAHALCEGVIERCGSDPLILSDVLLLVPTRRAARSLREAFAEALGGAALIPRIRALGDVDDEELTFDAGDDVLASAISPLRRRLLLATLVQRWGEGRGSPLPFVQAMTHAGELGQFLDEAVSHGCDLSKLETLAPDELAEHWQDVLTFLRIIVEEWPKQLAAESAVEPAAARDQRLRALAAALAAAPPGAPVIAAGSTGSIPATAELLKVIAQLPTGAVVLPGLDTDLDKGAWEELDAGHAQFGLRQLLAHLGVEREDVVPWSPLPGDHPERTARVRFISEALRPPPATDAWRDLIENERDTFAQALDGLSLVEAQNPREEALIVAIALREALETEGRTAALVTPDRGLARRVAAELTRWGIAIDDSAGQKLSSTPPAAFLSLLARAAAEGFPPVALLSLLKHPLAAGGDWPSQFRRRVRYLEHRHLRGLRPGRGLEGIAARLTSDADKDITEWFTKLRSILEPLAAALAIRDVPLCDLVRAHVKAAEALAATGRKNGAAALWRGESGEAAAKLVAELIRDGDGIALADGRHYAELFLKLADARAVRLPYNRQKRLAILGPLEARLLGFDLVVLGGLNEGTWPREAATDPWLSRPMRSQLGLEPPERRTGLAAHDFASLTAARSVLMTRALKDSGAPTVASRWVLRVQQLAKGLGLEKQLAARNDLLAWARAMDARETAPRAIRPAPAPPVALRPRKLSVTEIETWLRDPYAIYARHVLRLKPLDPLDPDPGPRERGVAIHRALEYFLRAYPDALPEDALERLVQASEEAFAAAGASPAVLALWRPRFARAASWFVSHETARRKEIIRSITETTGKLELPGAAGPFVLTGRADRIDLFADGSAAVIDYKTGRVPTDKQIELLFAPQLPLEGAMLMAGAFADASASRVREFVYLKLAGGDPPGEVFIAKADATAKALDARERLIGLIAAYDKERQGYRSREMPYRVTDKGDYDHLARVAEWSRVEDDE